MAAVNADVNVVLEVKSGLQPGAAARDQREAEKRHAGRVDILKVVDARRALQLADYNAFHAVYYEGAVVGHHRDHAKIDILLLDDFFGTKFPFYTKHCLDRRFIRFAATFAFVNGIFGSAERIMHEMHLQLLVVADDGESLREQKLQTFHFAFFGHFIALQEFGVRITLDRRQGRQGEFAEFTAVNFLYIAFFRTFHVVGKL